MPEMEFLGQCISGSMPVPSKVGVDAVLLNGQLLLPFCSPPLPHHGAPLPCHRQRKEGGQD